MTQPPALTDDYVICYRLQRETNPIKLRLWEPPVPSLPSHEQDLPYLYAVNFTFKTLQEAEAFLHGHLLSNGAFDVPETDFPEEGKIEILPYPTWSMEAQDVRQESMGSEW
jgi:hypothetical protein